MVGGCGILQLLKSVLPYSLEELHLSNNGYQEVTFRSDSSYPKLQRLFIGHNKLSQWQDFHTLGSVFPSLRSLMAASNPLVLVPLLDKDQSPFPLLSVLNLNNTLIDSWDSVDHLSSLPCLAELNILNVPVGRDVEGKVRRFEAICRLPQLHMLNKSSISVEEREDAERWMVRNYKDSHDHLPPTYPTLVAKHGPLNPLADVSLAPPCDADLEFHIDGKDPAVHRISLYQSTYQLKVWLSKKITGIPPSSMTLFYGDIEASEVYGLEEMRHNSKSLHSYRMKSGDCIYVDFK